MRLSDYIAAPRDEQELRSLVRTAFAQDHPFALHYPRDAGFGLDPIEPQVLPVGRAEVMREGHDLLLVGFGPIVHRALAVADAVERQIFDEIIVCTLPSGVSRWIHQDLPHRLARRTGLPVDHVVAVVHEGMTPAAMVRGLMSRHTKSE